jgi:hypothetical protein
MADEAQLKILRKGVEAWNKWRKANPTKSLYSYRSATVGSTRVARRAGM